MMPEEIAIAAFEKAMELLGFDVASVVEVHYDQGNLSVVSIQLNDDGTPVLRGSNPVYEASTYVLKPE